MGIQAAFSRRLAEANGRVPVPLGAGGFSTDAPQHRHPRRVDRSLGRPFFGSLSQLSELPDPMIEHLDAESAANLKAAMENPEQNAPPVFDAETIRDMQAWFPRSTGTAADFETPWYHSLLPPLRLEVVLLQYDRIVAETIDRASRRIEKENDGHATSKMNEVLFQLRSEMRTLFR